MSLEYILFDLDGTITDSAPGILNSINYALNKLGMKIENPKDLYKFLGPPLLDSFQNFCGLSRDEATKAVEYYREYFNPTGIFENTLYDGIEDLFQKLIAHNKKILLATSKPLIFAEKILSHFSIDQYFTFVAGSNLDGTRNTKAEVINYIFENYKIDDLTKAIMIGDRKHDILGAKATGLQSVGVLYGYGDRDELETAGADYIVQSPSAIADLLLR